tara:strand:- start:215 stop:484 length:270 start_codon:yes stop_codon:yes gene_type:complete
MAEDLFALDRGGLESPGVHQKDVTPDDNTDLAVYSRAIWVSGDAGDIAVHALDGTAETLKNIPAQYLYPYRARRILSTGTAATAIQILY